MKTLDELKIKIYADGANLEQMRALNDDPLIRGLTTNPTLMRKAGIRDYEQFCRTVLEFVTHKPLSLEVFADDFPQMRNQALRIAGWGDNVYVKIPVTNSVGESSMPLIKALTAEGIKLNVTAILTTGQVRACSEALAPDVPSIVSVFAGRIADTGTHPGPIMRSAKLWLQNVPMSELLWASVREPLNIAEAATCGCDIITVPHDILAKARTMWCMSLETLSLDTVKMFRKDALEAGFQL